MSLTAGTRLGPYEIVSALGAGGMGEVYKASDTRLNRTIAIKILPPHFASDPEMKQRFAREAQTIAGLNHPHICTLHDVGEQDGMSFLVMEHLEGETLAERLTRGPLQLDEVLKAAAEIADALDKAHRQNVIHRDLKPQNIMLTKAGTKLVDFGLAKWAASPSDSLAAQPTRMEVTAQGTVIGTMQYMAPEQVEGKEADTRTDLFAFGAVLYEMVTGKKAFEGKSQASLIGAIMKSEPRPVSHLQPLTPAALERLVQRCLVKDPEERWQTARDLLVQLEWIGRGRTDVSISPAVAEAERRRNKRITVGIAGALAIAAGLSVPAFLYWKGPPAAEAFQFRHTIIGLSATDIAVSPDGRTIVFVAKPDTVGSSTLYVRPIGSVNSRKLGGTDNAAQPFWSPDSRFVGYVVGEKLKKVEISSGAVQDISDAPGFAGGAWSPAGDGTILFGSEKGLYRVSAEGGKAVALTQVSQGETGHLWPDFLGDGTHYLFLTWSDDSANRAVHIGDLNSKDRKRLMAGDSNVMYARSSGDDYVLFRRQAVLFSQRLNMRSLALVGDPSQIVTGVASSMNGRGVFSASRAGSLIYFQGNASGGPSGRGRTVQSQFGFVERTGGHLEIAVETGPFGDMDLSPDGKLIAITRQESGAVAADVWVFDWQKYVSWRLTTDPSDDVDPVWSPDGRRVAFTSYRKGNADIYIKNANNVGDETPLLESPLNESVKDWSKDGKYLAFECGQDSFQDICAAAFDADGKLGKPFPVVQGKFQKNEPQFSYDGNWLAYVADVNESGTFQVYVMSFPDGKVKQQISTDGGGQPRWRRDGKEIYFRSLDNRLMAADISLGAKIEAGVPHVMFNAPNPNPTAADPARHMWTALPDGSRFLLRVALGGGRGQAAGASPVLVPQFSPAGQNSARSGRGAPTSGLTVILNWPSAVARGDK